MASSIDNVAHLVLMCVQVQIEKIAGLSHERAGNGNGCQDASGNEKKKKKENKRKRGKRELTTVTVWMFDEITREKVRVLQFLLGLASIFLRDVLLVVAIIELRDCDIGKDTILCLAAGKPVDEHSELVLCIEQCTGFGDDPGNSCHDIVVSTVDCC